MEKIKVQSQESTLKKTCVKCTQKKPLNQFYTNNDLVPGHLKDFWCKQCVQKYVKDLKSLKEYCHFNCRSFSEELYNRSCEKVDLLLPRDKEYLSLKDLDKKDHYRFEKIALKYFAMMNGKQYYRFIDNTYDTEADIQSLEKSLHDKRITNATATLLSQEKQYDSVWFGEFTELELAFLNNFYSKLEASFDISDVHMEDNFRAVAKAALERNQAQNDMRNGVSGAASRYQKATDIYLKLSDAAKLSASKRTVNENVGFGALGLLIDYMENDGHLNEQSVFFAPDDIDRCINYNQNILASISSEEMEKKTQSHE